MKKFLINHCFIAILVLLAACGGPTQTIKEYNKGIHITPAPKSLVKEKGAFKLDKATQFYAQTKEAAVIAEFFNTKIKNAAGLTLKINQAKSNNGILLSINSNLKTNKEGYTLKVTPKKVEIVGKTAQGLFYGMQTFMQLLPAEIESPTLVSNTNWEAPCVTIKDEPRFVYRGLMIDVCRHFMPMETILRQIDVLAMMKINKLHLHLTEDQGWRIEIKKYPKLTQIGSKRINGDGKEYGGFYTQEQIKKIVAYAAERYITIVPELEVPGHELAAIAAYPELSCNNTKITPRNVWGVESIVMCPGKESTFEFIENVIKEMVTLFPGEYFHIGGDECPKNSWKNCPLCQKKIKKEGLQATKEHSAEERLQSYVITRVEKILNKYGKKMIGWDEILEGGLAPSATVMSWRGEAGGIKAAQMNHNVIMTPGSGGMYIDHYQGDPKIEPVAIGGYAPLSKTYRYNPVPKKLEEAGKSNFILGAQCNMWTEYVYTPKIMEYRVYPRIVALSELTWTPLEKKDFKDFNRRLQNFSVRLDLHGINYHMPLPEQPGGSCDLVAFTDSAKMEFKTTRPIKMVYTLDGSTPTINSTEYTQPIIIKETTNLKIATVLWSGKTSKVRTIKVKKEALATAKQVKETTPGLKMETAKGLFFNTKEMAKAKNWESSIIKNIGEVRARSIKDLRQPDCYATVATGYINIPSDGVYYFSSNNTEVWIDNTLLINNNNEVKRFSRHDGSKALAKGLHKIKVVFLAHIDGGWPSTWDNGAVSFRKANQKRFKTIGAEMLSH